jgi:hypothetical protein
MIDRERDKQIVWWWVVGICQVVARPRNSSTSVMDTQKYQKVYKMQKFEQGMVDDKFEDNDSER